MEPAEAAQALTTWFGRHGRDLPWRRRHDPYHVLLVEFLLQQTRIEVGTAYYARFVERFPTLEDLAAADESDVLCLWSGLGYYDRARRLHATARRIVALHGGRVPEDAATLRTLPGIGPYTAGAIASIAYDRPEPALDGNQLRVLGRALGLGGDPASRRNRGAVEAWSRRLLAYGSPRLLNQALMDVGSGVCRPTAPACDACPLTACRSRGRVRSASRLPSERPHEDWEALVHVRDGRVWLAPPAGRGLLGHAWLPPLRRSRRPLDKPDLLHAFSHKSWRIRLVRPRGPPSGAGRWVDADGLKALPHGALTARIVRAAVLARPSVPRPRLTRSGRR